LPFAKRVVTFGVGALVAALARRTDLPGIEFCFATLPTLWQASNGVDYGFFDVVVSSGSR
jgi:hypothetical protein